VHPNKTLAEVLRSIPELIAQASANGLRLDTLAWTKREGSSLLHFVDLDAQTCGALTICGTITGATATHTSSGLCASCLPVVRRSADAPAPFETSVRQAYQQLAAGARSRSDLAAGLELTEPALVDHLHALGLGADVRGSRGTRPSLARIAELRRGRAEACLRCAAERAGDLPLTTRGYTRVRERDCPQWLRPRTIALMLGTPWRAAHRLAGLPAFVEA
jgi:hypothetical protein